MEAVRFGSWAKPLLMTWCGDRGPRLVELIRIRLGDGNPRFSRYASAGGGDRSLYVFCGKAALWAENHTYCAH